MLKSRMVQVSSVVAASACVFFFAACRPKSGNSNPAASISVKSSSNNDKCEVTENGVTTFKDKVNGVCSASISTGGAPVQKDVKVGDGKYTCEQQKEWGKCSEAWMTPTCDYVCKADAKQAAAPAPAPAPTGNTGNTSSVVGSAGGAGQPMCMSNNNGVIVQGFSKEECKAKGFSGY